MTMYFSTTYTILYDPYTKAWRSIDLTERIARLCREYPDEAGQEGMLDHLLEMAFFCAWPLRVGEHWVQFVVTRAIECGALPKEDLSED